MRFLRLLLYPFALLFDAITSIRNRLYETGVQRSTRFEVPVIGVGNLSVGGTGKTPMVEYLIRLLSPKMKVATLSRGYKRKSSGIRIANSKDDASTIGDEPFQYFTKFGDTVVVAVGEERVMAIPYILHEYPDTEVVLLDDAFQHRRVRPAFQILLTDYNNLFTNDFLLPAGSLREAKRGANRADVVVVTKCPPHITDDEMMKIEGAIRWYSSRPVFFSAICYRNLMPVTEHAPYRPEKVVLVTGIANPVPMADYLRQSHEIVRHFSFGDHHAYTADELRSICDAAARSQAIVVTTEKDIVRMDVSIFRSASVSLHYLPIEIELLKSGKDFDEMVLNAIRSYVS